MPGFVSWVLGIVFWVLEFVCWVLGIVFCVLGFLCWVLGFVFWVLGLVFWVSLAGRWGVAMKVDALKALMSGFWSQTGREKIRIFDIF